MKKYLLYIVIFLIGVLAGMWAHRQYHFRDEVEMVRDTTFVTDTHIIEKPVVKEKHIKETLFVEVHDTTRIHDTLYLALPSETRVYTGEQYYAEISGYKPSLDRIEVYPKTAIITETKTIASDPKKHSISIGAELNYSNALSFPVQLEYAYKARSWLEVYGYTEYELLRKQFGIGAGTKMSLGF